MPHTLLEAPLIATAPRPLPGRNGSATRPVIDPDRALADALIHDKIATEPMLAPLLERRRAGEPASLVELLVQEQHAKLEEILVAILHRSHWPYIPLAQYAFDREIPGLLSREFCRQHHVIAFERISRSILVATANPFAPTIRQQVEQELGCRTHWYVAAPAEIAQALQTAFAEVEL